jgi:cyclopropane fatty-acyl-phospholipid synthase-like methyltransferase
MEEMFAAVSDLYAEYWNDFFHFALFEGDESWEEAFAATHRRYMDELRVETAERVLVLACGRGGFADVIARHTDGEVLGIDISRPQLAHTRRFDRPNLRFRHFDAMDVDALPERFDAAVCLDAACYFPNRERFVAKVARILRPGARFLLVDWCRRGQVNRLQEELVLAPFMRAWAIDRLETPNGYRRHFEQSHFGNVILTDLNEQVRRNWNFGYAQALNAVADLSEQNLLALIRQGMKLGPRGIALQKEQFAAALYIKAAFDAGLLRYVHMLAEKP